MNLRHKIILFLSSFFYVGYLPFIPGTFGSLAGLLLFYFIKDNILIYAGGTLICVSIGLFVSGEAERILNKKDAKIIVIDEVSGMLMSLIFLPYDIKLVIIAFFLFRILDIFKPYPAGRLQQLGGGLGVMSDDMVAGIYTNIIIQIALRLTAFKIS
jgi:phosphatidylglycerophosphatase A